MEQITPVPTQNKHVQPLPVSSILNTSAQHSQEAHQRSLESDRKPSQRNETDYSNEKTVLAVMSLEDFKVV